MKLDLGCGPDWVKARHMFVGLDRVNHGQQFVHDFTERLPFSDNTFDVIVAHHSLPTLMFHELMATLIDLHRITTAGGVLRISVPSFERAARAYTMGDRAWFPIEDRLMPNTMSPLTIDEAFCLYVTWFGHHRSVFTGVALQNYLDEAGWRAPIVCDVHVTVHGREERHAGITLLDSRPEESLYVEAVK